MQIIKVLAKSGAIEILQALSHGKKRDKDLKEFVAHPGGYGRRFIRGCGAGSRHGNGWPDHPTG